MSPFLRVSVLVSVTVLAGCVHMGEASTAPLEASLTLAQAPSKNGSFTFCPAPARPDAPAEGAEASPTMHLTNAAWLAFIAANEYSHARSFGPLLGSLGFHNPDVSDDLMWEQCTVDLRELRSAQTARAAELTAALGTPKLRSVAKTLLPSDGSWGSCARAVLEDDALPVDVFPAISFQKNLVQTVHPGRYLQFFSAGAAAEGGKKWQDGSTQVVFARHRELPLVILSFRGTETSQMSDVAADLQTWKTPLADRGWPAEWGSAHAGFISAFESIEPLLMEKLKEVPQDVKIWVTGHSLGGALATLMTARLLRANDEGAHFDIAGSYTFGSPRVGNKAFAKQFRESAARHGTSAVRIRNGSDAITALPGIMLEFEHVGTLAWLLEGKIELAPKDEPPYGMISVPDHDIRGFGPTGNSISGYYRRLSELAALGKYPELDRCAPHSAKP